MGMLVFIDESGDTGLQITQGATKFFTIVMAVFEDMDEAHSCVQRICLLRRELRVPEGFEFHFHQNSLREREAFLRAVLPYQFFYYGIVIDKAKLFGEGFKNKESFYKYACGLLFENAKEKLRSAIVVIDSSGRDLFKYQLASYLSRRMNTEEGHTLIKKMKMQDSHRNELLQLADMLAGAVNRSLSVEKREAERFRAIIKPREMYVQIWPK
ncbi:MAG TPA: DUF3800 domain-containing protein [Acidobacteriota bacterium]|nr:DUF3800 domain-containing protein [Acidobacteriota bacterium]